MEPNWITGVTGIVFWVRSVEDVYEIVGKRDSERSLKIYFSSSDEQEIFAKQVALASETDPISIGSRK